jgi:DMSO/TMAO reductase YedYZ molybdopterin-dependent catalytic subunit
MGSKIMKILKLVAAMTICLMFLTSCTILGWVITPSGDGTSSATEDRYAETEIRDYKGIKLDPSVGPRDNSIKGIQEVDLETYTLKVSGLVESPISISYEEVLALKAYEKLITLYCVEGWDATVLWKGARLPEVIDLAGAKKTANTVIFHCVDGYTTSMPLQTIIDKDMILAYSSNGITLPASLGFPFIVVAEDKLGYKWARWVSEIELTDNEYYQGYWEGNGYDNTADVPTSRK